MTLPGDARLIGAIRQLAAHAADYARLTTDACDRLASEVERAAAVAISSTQVSDAAIEVRFSGDHSAVNVVISCDAPTTAPHSTSDNGVSVNWTADGSRHTCHIRQGIPA